MHQYRHHGKLALPTPKSHASLARCAIFLVVLFFSCTTNAAELILEEMMRTGVLVQEEGKAVDRIAITGRVVDSTTGEPIAKATIGGYTKTLMFTIALAQSDVDGNFQITESQLKLRANRHVSLVCIPLKTSPFFKNYQAIENLSATEVPSIEFKLSKGQLATRNVFDSSTNDPIPGRFTVKHQAEETATNSGIAKDVFRQIPPKTARMGIHQAGHGKLLLSEGKNEVTFLANDYQRYQFDSLKQCSIKFELDVQNGKLDSLPKVSLAPLPSYRIPIVRPDGSAIEDLQVGGEVPSYQRYFENPFYMQKDELHSSTITVFGPDAGRGRPLIILNEKEKLGAAVQLETVCTDPTELNRPITLKPCAVLSGKFTGSENENAFQGVKARAMLQGITASEVQINPDGSFLFDDLLPEGEYSIRFFGMLKRNSGSSHLNYRMTVGKVAAGQEFDLGKVDIQKFFSISGRVTDRNTARPVANATVRLRGYGSNRKTTTDKNGEYQLPLLSFRTGKAHEPDMLFVSTKDSLYPAHQIPIDKEWVLTEKKSFGIQLSRSRIITGTVKDSENRRPLAGRLYFNSTNSHHSTIVEVGTDGNFELQAGAIDEPTQGDLEFIAQQSGRYSVDQNNGLRNVVMPVEFKASEAPGSLRVRLEPTDEHFILVRADKDSLAQNFSMRGTFRQNVNGYSHTGYTPMPEGARNTGVKNQPENGIAIYGLESDGAARLLVASKKVEDHWLVAGRFIPEGLFDLNSLEPMTLEKCGTATFVCTELASVRVEINVPGFERVPIVNDFTYWCSKEGSRYTIEALVPGMKHRVIISDGSRTKVIDIPAVAAGQNLDLGNIKFD